MDAISAGEFFCPHCSAAVSADARDCPACGAALTVAPPPGTGASASPPPRRDMLDNPWVVLGILFLATAALGLPILWKSKGFSPGGKIVVGVAVIVYTALLIWLATWAVQSAWRSFQELAR